MRLALTAALDSRDGVEDKDARMTNALAEAEETGNYACVRPSLVTSSINTGDGNAVVDFNGVLITVFGTALGAGSAPVSIGTVEDGKYDAAQSPI